MVNAPFPGVAFRAILVLACTVTRTGAAPLTDNGETLPLRCGTSLSALGFPGPLLRATVRGVPVWFIVDSGASTHALASWVVSVAHLETRRTKSTVAGSTGVERPVRAITNQKIGLEGGHDLTLRDAIVVEFPPDFAEQRIGGLVSPQLLATRHVAAVLDLRTPLLRFEPFDRAAASLGRDRRWSRVVRAYATTRSRHSRIGCTRRR